jgi:hypothetical protein
MPSLPILLLFLQLLTTPTPVQTGNIALAPTLLAHGGTAVDLVQSIQIQGTLASIATRTPQPVVISASMDGRIRIDFGTPVERSVITTSQGRFEVRGANVDTKPGHVGLFSALDMLSVLGIRRLSSSTVDVTSLGAGTVATRATTRIKAVTRDEKTFYRRKLTDETEIDIDNATGLVARTRRVQYAEQSLDRPFWLAQDFSDYRTVQGVVLPFRVDSSVDGRVVSILTVTSVTINPPLASNLWEKP